MPRRPKADPDRITTLEQKRERIDRALRKARDAVKQQARADDTRRKIIGGSLALEHAAQHPASPFAKVYGGLLRDYVRPEDRWLFADMFRALLPTRDAEALIKEGEAARNTKKQPANTDTAPAFPEVAE